MKTKLKIGIALCIPAFIVLIAIDWKKALVVESIFLLIAGVSLIVSDYVEY